MQAADENVLTPPAEPDAQTVPADQPGQGLSVASGAEGCLPTAKTPGTEAAQRAIELTPLAPDVTPASG